MLSMSNLTIERDNKTILKKANYQFMPGTITCITGPSGIGKSTLLSCIAQLYTAYQGDIAVDETNLASVASQQRARLVGKVFQGYNLFPQLTALDNIVQPLQVVAGMKKDVAVSKALSLLKSFGMQEYANASSTQLSGGQQQRIALARALALNPKVLLLDEPTSALDAENTQLLITQVKRLKEEGITIVIASHDREFVKQCADTVLKIQDSSLSIYNDKEDNEPNSETNFSVS